MLDIKKAPILIGAFGSILIDYFFGLAGAAAGAAVAGAAVAGAAVAVTGFGVIPIFFKTKSDMFASVG